MPNTPPPRFNHEVKKLLALSLPLILGQLAQSSMGFVDTVMAGRVSANDLAAVAVGSSLWFPIFLFLLGTLSALTPTVAQARGAANHEAIRQVTPQGVYLGTAAGILILIGLRQMHPLLHYFAVEPKLLPVVKGYLNGISWGFPAIGACFALRYSSEGLSLARPGMLISFAGLAVNIVANYALVFGKWGLPALGGVGCGVASALTMWVMLLGMVWIMWRGKAFRTLKLLRCGWRPAPAIIGQLLRLGLPIGGGLFVECSIFAVIALLVSRFGVQAVAAHQIALSVTSMLFMVPLSISAAISVRVGYTIGQQRPSHTIHCARTGIIVTIIFAVCSALAMVLFSTSVVGIYTTDPALISGASALLLMAAIFQIPDGIQVSCCGALRGCKDTRMPMIIQTIAYWGIGLPIGSALGLGLGMGARGFWIGLICGLSSAALMLAWRLRNILYKK